MTLFRAHLQRRVWLLVACLMFVLAPRPASDVAPRDVSVLSVAASTGAGDRTAWIAPVRQNAVASAPALSLAVEMAASTKSTARRTAPADRRYLYLELVTLLS